MSDYVRASLEWHKNVDKLLDRLAGRLGLQSKGEVFQKALQLLSVVADNEAPVKKCYIQNPDGSLAEVLLTNPLPPLRLVVNNSEEV